MKKFEEKIEEIKANLSSCTGFFDGLVMMNNNPGTQNISKMFNDRMEEVFKELNELKESLKRSL